MQSSFCAKPRFNSVLTLSVVMMIASTTATADKVLTSELINKAMHGHFRIQLGGYWGVQGNPQQININGLIGDYFSVTNKHDSNGLFGVGYYVNGQDKDKYDMSYGLNWFYLAKMMVAGTVLQENLFENLSYRYHVTSYPLYAMAKSNIKTKSPDYGIYVDAGIGPNFMTTSDFREMPLNNNYTIPDNIFSGKTTTTFSATAGIGLTFNNIVGKAPLECGYRFFYLGQGHFNVLSDQVINGLNTGSSYANALVCSLII